MRHIHKCQGDYKAQPAAVVDHLFNAVDDKGQINKSVQPHWVHELHYHIAHKRVKQAEKHCCGVAAAL